MVPNIKNQRSGFSLIELLITVAIIGLLMAVALPSWQDHLDNVDNGLAIVDISRVEQAIERFYIDNNRYPATLAETELDGLLDPWGNSYWYLGFDEDTPSNDKRKDKNLNPVNSDFDLYSMGKDEQTARAFTANFAKDDVVRANDGEFVGLADDY